MATMLPHGGFTSGMPWTRKAGASPAGAALPDIHANSVRDGSPGTSPFETMPVEACTYKMCDSGSYDPPGQLVTPVVRMVPNGPSGLLTAIGVKIGPILNFEITVRASARSSGVKLIRSSTEGIPATPYAGGFV